jgi:type IV pilus assembly protein PilA
MKKMLKSKKGFSLIELLIVVAILAILAAISINLFGGVLNRQKDKSDLAAASYLQKALQTYIAETDDDDLSDIGGSDATTVAEKLSKGVEIKGIKYGPYLNSKELKLSRAKGFKVTIDKSNQVVTVVPDPTNATSITIS